MIQVWHNVCYSYSAILGGQHNTASGEGSMAFGSNGNATDAYSAVLSFDSTGTICDSQGDGTVNICADGGLFVNGMLAQTQTNTENTESLIQELQK